MNYEPYGRGPDAFETAVFEMLEEYHKHLERRGHAHVTSAMSWSLTFVNSVRRELKRTDDDAIRQFSPKVRW